MEVLEKVSRQFSPAVIKSRELIKHLPANEQDGVMELIQASKLTDNIIVEQLSHEGVPAIEKVTKELEQAKKDQNETKIKDSEALLKLLTMFHGPYALPTGENFLPGHSGKAPPEAGFYPKGTTKEQIDAFIAAHPESKKELLALDTVVESDGHGGYKAIPFSERYKQFVDPMCDHLNKAADYFEATQKELAQFLRHRSAALRANEDLYETDIEWMNLPPNCPIDIVIGPIETYDDQIHGAKASYETIIFVQAADKMAKLQRFRSLMDQMEMAIPLESKYRQKKGEKKEGESETTSAQTRIELYNVVHLGGSSSGPMFTLAHNLPNDERVVTKYGTRNQFYLTIQNLKMEKILKPISEVIIAPQFLKYVTSEGFFMHVLLHELSHTLGPHNVRNDPSVSTVRQALGKSYTAIEECKADTLSFVFAHFIVNGTVKEEEEEKKEHTPLLTEQDLYEIYVSNFASIFRSIRFGYKSAHGIGCVIQINWLLKHGAVIPPPSGTLGYTFDFDKWPSALLSLAEELLAIKINGDLPRAEKLIKEYGTDLSPTELAHLKALEPLPIDLDVTFDTN